MKLELQFSNELIASFDITNSILKQIDKIWKNLDINLVDSTKLNEMDLTIILRISHNENLTINNKTILRRIDNLLVSKTDINREILNIIFKNLPFDVRQNAFQ